MSLLPDELKARLPPLEAQEADFDPVVYVRLHVPGTSENWYVLEGEVSGHDFLLFCLFESEGENCFGRFSLAALEAIRGPEGQAIERDLKFAEGRLTDVVPAPDP